MRNSYYKKINFGKMQKNKFGRPIISKEDLAKYKEELYNNEKLALIFKHLVYPKNSTLKEFD